MRVIMLYTITLMLFCGHSAAVYRVVGTFLGDSCEISAQVAQYVSEGNCTEVSCFALNELSRSVTCLSVIPEVPESITNLPGSTSTRTFKATDINCDAIPHKVEAYAKGVCIPSHDDSIGGFYSNKSFIRSCDPDHSVHGVFSVDHWEWHDSANCSGKPFSKTVEGTKNQCRQHDNTTGDYEIKMCIGSDHLLPTWKIIVAIAGIILAVVIIVLVVQCCKAGAKSGYQTIQ